MSRKVAVLATVLFLFSTAARADIIDPIIGVRGGDFSIDITAALGEPITGDPCTVDDQAALCWGFENDTGQFITAFTGMFNNPACDPSEPTVEDCFLSLDPGSEFETLQTFPEDEGFGLQEFRLSGGIVPPAPPDENGEIIILGAIGPLALLSDHHFFFYGFGFTEGTTLTITQIETVPSIPEPSALALLLAGIAVAAGRRRFQLRRPSHRV